MGHVPTSSDDVALTVEGVMSSSVEARAPVDKPSFVSQDRECPNPAALLL